jgi:hypothetical protein
VVAPPLPPLSTTQVFVVAQAYRLDPAATFVLKNNSPTPQVGGNTVPVLNGFVEAAAEKSTSLDCVRKSTSV